MMMTYRQVKELHSRVHPNNRDDANTKRATVAFELEEASSDVITMAETDDEEEEEVLEDCYESEEETQIAQAMARAAFTKSASTPMLNLLLKAAFQEEQAAQNINNNKTKRTIDELTATMTGSTRRPPTSTSSSQSFKKARRGGLRTTTTSTTSKTSPFRLSASAPSLKSLDKKQQPTSSITTIKPSEKLQSLPQDVRLHELDDHGLFHQTIDGADRLVRYRPGPCGPRPRLVNIEEPSRHCPYSPCGQQVWRNHLARFVPSRGLQYRPILIDGRRSSRSGLLRLRSDRPARRRVDVHARLCRH
jgi:hypothetical protein